MHGINKYTRSGNSIGFSPRPKQSLLIGLIIILLAAVVFLSISYVRASGYRSQIEQQFNKRINSAVIDAIEQVNRLSGGVQANSAARLAVVRQYVYSIDQLNQINTTIHGEAGRLVPQEAISILYEDLDTYDMLVQTATSSTLEIRTALLTHLTALKELI